MGELTDELSPALQQTRERLSEKFDGRVTFHPPFRGELTAVTGTADLREVLTFLRDDEALAYRHLSDICGVDRLPQVPRFEVVYHLFSLPTGARLRLKVKVDEGQGVPTVTGLWRGANFPEREVFDMFGIPFTGHPNLQRILTPDDFEGHPLRKDFALGSERVTFDIPYRKRFGDATD